MKQEWKEADFATFFSWLLEKEVTIHKEPDITLVMSQSEPYIYYPDEIKWILETEAMQRLGRITQLGNCIHSNPTSYHTRLAHCKGAGFSATKFFAYQFEKADWRKRVQQQGQKLEIFADIVQMYTHDIGHNILSHTLEKVIQHDDRKATHEVLGSRILNEDEEMVQVLQKIHPQLLATLNKVAGPDYSLRTLKEGSLDFDRLDFLVRDSLYFGREDGRQKAERLLASCEIAAVAEARRRQPRLLPAFDAAAVQEIEEILEQRVDYYENEYCSNEIIAYNHLLRYFCESLIRSKDKGPLPKFLRHCMKHNVQEIDLQEFKKWDDVRFYNELIEIAKNSPDEKLRMLGTQCLPGLEGLINLSYELLDWTDETAGQLEGYQKAFYENVKDLVKNPSDLQRKLILRKPILFLDAKGKAEVEEVFLQLQEKGIAQEKLETLITWKREFKKYDKKENPIYIKQKSGEIAVLDLEEGGKHANCGMLLFPMQMCENGFTEEEIRAAEKVLQLHQEKHKKKAAKKDTRSVYEKEDMLMKWER